METVSGDHGLSKPLAAYRLGFLSRTYSKWSELFRDKPQFEWGTAQGVEFSIQQLDDAALNLAAEVPANLYGELKAWLKVQSERWASVVGMVWRFYTGDARWDHQVVAATRKDGSSDLRTIADLIFEHLAGLKPWFSLGASLGEYESRLYFLESSSPPPEITGIVAAAHTLGSHANLPPVLGELLLKASTSPTQRPRDFLAEVTPSGRRISDHELFDSGFDNYVIERLIMALDSAIRSGLQEIITSNEPHVSDKSLPEGHLKPRWEKSRDGSWVGELWLGNDIVRSVRQLAKNVILILDEFEKAEWPPSIVDPLPGDDPLQRHDAIRSLNENLKCLQFYGCGDNKRIGWRQTDRQGTSHTPPIHLP